MALIVASAHLEIGNGLLPVGDLTGDLGNGRHNVCCCWLLLPGGLLILLRRCWLWILGTIINLVVTLKQRCGFWPPVYAHTSLQFEAAYASNGDVSFRESEPTQFHSAGDQAVGQYEGHYQLTDRSWGVMSLPGYRDYLARQVAVTLLTSMQEQLKP